MTKKNKSKRNKEQDYFPSLYMMQDDYPVNKYDGLSMPTQNISQMAGNTSSPQLTGLQPDSYQAVAKYGTTPQLNKESLGSSFSENFKNMFSTEGLNVLGNAAASVGAGALGTLGGNLISGGKSSGVGNAIGDVGGAIGGAAMMVNPVLGGAVMLGSKLIGGGINALFGSRMNYENINRIENELNQSQNYNSSATNFDELTQEIMSAPSIGYFSKSDIGSDGLFSNKASRKFRELSARKKFVEDWVNRSQANSATNLQQNQLNDQLMGWFAYGGPLDYNYGFGGGAIGYDLANQQLGIDNIKAMGQNRQYALPNLGLNTFAEGGGIHIKPENRGKFTALKKRTGKSATWFKKHGTPAQRKMATFELNARKWKHAFGGDLLTNGTVFSNNVNIIGNGNSHEDNIYGGVQVGVDPQGIPNLVEQDEVIWNDYVFSNRILVPDAVRNKYKLKGTKDMSFSDAAKKVQKASEERPNDPIAQDTLDINLSRLAQEQETVREQKNMNNKNTFKEGGQKRTKKQVGQSAWDAYLGLIQKDDNRQPSYTINPLGLTKDDFAEVGMVDKDPYANITFNKNNDTPLTSRWFDETTLRYAPVAGSAIGLGQTLLSSPDYSRADALAQYAQNAGNVTPISYDPLGNYLTYRPNDVEYIANKMAAQAAATRRNIMNTSGGNRANAVGSLLAADYNSQIAQADAIRQEEDTNWNRLMQTETFNRGTNQYNSETALKAAMANQEARMKASQLGLSGYSTAMQMKDDIDAQRNASISANLTNLFDSLGDIGREEVVKGMVKNNPALLYDYFGRYKGNVGAKGGKLNRKKRGGFTY